MPTLTVSKMHAMHFIINNNNNNLNMEISGGVKCASELSTYQ